MAQSFTRQLLLPSEKCSDVPERGLHANLYPTCFLTRLFGACWESDPSSLSLLSLDRRSLSFAFGCASALTDPHASDVVQVCTKELMLDVCSALR